MAHQVKCFYCGKYFDRDKINFTKVNGNRYAHVDCNAETTKPDDQSEQNDLKALETYICKLFKTDHINPRVYKQIKDFYNNYNYTYSGMMKALIYFYEIKGNSIEKANGGIGIIPYIYDSAYQYYYAIWQAKQSNEAIPIDVYEKPPVVIKITSPQRVDKRKKLFSFLDGEDINA